MSTAFRFDLTDLTLFLHVVEEGSITAGAARSHLSLASASVRIRGMEEVLGVSLLERQRSGTKPTGAGLATAHHARLALQQLERMRGELDTYKGGLAGTIRILSNTAAITDYLPQVLADFLIDYPAIDIDLEERSSHVIVRQLMDGGAEVGIIADSVDVSALEVTPFRADTLVVVTGRKHLLAKRRRISFAEALGFDVVGLGDESALQQHLNLQAEFLGRRMHTRIRLRSFDAVCRMVEAGVGIAVMPKIAAERCARSMDLRLVQLSEPWADRRLLICVRRFDNLSAPADRLVAALRTAN